MGNTKTKGDIAEIEVIRFFVLNDYKVSIPYGENNPYDLIVESPLYNLYRIQVKYATELQNCITLRLRQMSKNYCRTVSFERIDVFTVFCPTKDIFIIPIDKVKENRNRFTLRFAHSKNNQCANVNFAHEYFENLSFVP